VDQRYVGEMISRSVTVVNQLGMHARAAAKFVHLAARFASNVRVARDGREMDGKSIMGILLLAAARGSILTISAEGADERNAVDALAALVASGFGEDVQGAEPIDAEPNEEPGKRPASGERGRGPAREEQ